MITAVNGCLIAGDFNVDFNLNPGDYANVLGLPSVNATAENTSLKDNPPLAINNPLDYRANAYDNIFQKPIGGAHAGFVTDLLVESAIVPAPALPPPAAQPYAGFLATCAANFDVAHIPNIRTQFPIAALPPTDMGTAWDFVREAISNHYPVRVTTTI